MLYTTAILPIYYNNVVMILMLKKSCPTHLYFILLVVIVCDFRVGPVFCTVQTVEENQNPPQMNLPLMNLSTPASEKCSLSLEDNNGTHDSHSEHS